MPSWIVVSYINIQPWTIQKPARHPFMYCTEVKTPEQVTRLKFLARGFLGPSWFLYAHLYGHWVWRSNERLGSLGFWRVLRSSPNFHSGIGLTTWSTVQNLIPTVASKRCQVSAKMPGPWQLQPFWRSVASEKMERSEKKEQIFMALLQKLFSHSKSPMKWQSCKFYSKPEGIPFHPYDILSIFQLNKLEWDI